jgi:NADH:ubiquinone oxidoreductase subunit C
MEQQPPQPNDSAQEKTLGFPPTPEAGGKVPPRPARRPPHEEEAPTEVLNERGQATAAALGRVVGSRASSSGGRDDIPWVLVMPDHLFEVLSLMKEHPETKMDMLHLLFAVDYLDHLQLIYILASLSLNQKAMVKVDLPVAGDDAQATVDSAVALWEAAGWYERETHDLFGVRFEGNPDMSPLLLYEGFEGFPGRKSFPFNEYTEY